MKTLDEERLRTKAPKFLLRKHLTSPLYEEMRFIWSWIEEGKINSISGIKRYVGNKIYLDYMASLRVDEVVKDHNIPCGIVVSLHAEGLDSAGKRVKYRAMFHVYENGVYMLTSSLSPIRGLT